MVVGLICLLHPSVERLASWRLGEYSRSVAKPYASTTSPIEISLVCRVSTSIPLPSLSRTAFSTFVVIDNGTPDVEAVRHVENMPRLRDVVDRSEWQVGEANGRTT